MTEEEEKAIEIVKNIEYNKNIFMHESLAIAKVLSIIKKQQKENTDLKDLYIRTAKHLDKRGHFELSEYMLAQIEATPTFTTWEEYTTWVSKAKIRDILSKLNYPAMKHSKNTENVENVDINYVELYRNTNCERYFN